MSNLEGEHIHIRKDTEPPALTVKIAHDNLICFEHRANFKSGFITIIV